MFGIGSGEVLVVLALVVVLLRPEDLPAFARAVGKAVGRLREYYRAAQDAGTTLQKDLVALDGARSSRTREQMRATLRGQAPDRLVILDIRDNIGFLSGGRLSAPSLADWVKTAHGIGADANVIVGEADYLPATHPLGRRRRVVEDTPARRVVEITQPTPAGDLLAQEAWEPGQKPARTRMFLETEADYERAMALLQALRECRGDIVTHLAGMRREIADGGLFTVFVPQPLEMFFLILHDHMVLHYIDWPETYARAMAEVEKTGHFIIDCAAEAGADMIMFGGAGTEIFSPEMIENHIVAPAADYAEHCRKLGLFSLMHCCGRTRLLLERGWIDRIRPTVFESFTREPLGDIADPAAAAARLPPETFFKGGLDLDRLLCGSQDECTRMTQVALAGFGGRRFILAGTCAVLVGTPRANLLAVTAAAQAAGG